MEVTCRRCGLVAPALEHPPLPTALGAEVAAKVCRACWKEWQAMQVMVINEYRLNLLDPAARAVLAQQMRTFLNLE